MGKFSSLTTCIISAHSSNLTTNVYHSDSCVLQITVLHPCSLSRISSISWWDLSWSTEPNVGVLSTEPFLVGVYDGTKHRLIKCTGVCGITRYHCSTCPSSNPNYNHLEVFKEWEAEDSILKPEQASMNEASKFPSISQHRIPYPLPEHLRRLHDVYEAWEQSLTNVLVPGYNPDQRCKHGNTFNSDDPIFSGWVTFSEVIVYKYSVTITSATRKLYYWPAQGGCNCRSFYDGQDDLLFNLDNKHLFTYGLLFQYLHLMIEGKIP